MLARRFAIICLLMSVFGMVFAILVAEASRSHRRLDDAGLCRFAIICLLMSVFGRVFALRVAEASRSHRRLDDAGLCRFACADLPRR